MPGTTAAPNALGAGSLPGKLESRPEVTWPTGPHWAPRGTDGTRGIQSSAILGRDQLASVHSVGLPSHPHLPHQPGVLQSWLWVLRWGQVRP